MAELNSPRRRETALRTLAATLGTLPVAVLVALALSRHLPLSEDARFACGFGLVIPLWVTAIHLGFLTQSAGTAWLACGGASLVLAALAF